jgi:dTDP-4-dehydrorhamnose reductase
LGKELRAKLSALGVEVFAPARTELDITRSERILKALERYDPDVVVHAAYTNVSGAETEREACWETHVEGTSNVVRALAGRQAKLIHISTD